MGGYGSTRWGWHREKYTVENCKSLDIADLTAKGTLEPGTLSKRGTGSGVIRWYWSDNGEESASILFSIDTSSHAPHINLTYKVTSGESQEHIHQRVPISYTPVHFGGKRAWLHCPACNRRVRALHCPPNSVRFRCRQCYDLTYASVQSAHSHDRGKYAFLGSGYKHERDIEKLYNQLFRCRAGSKNFKRIKARIDRLEAQRATIRALSEATTRALFAGFEARFPKPAESPADDDLDALLENIRNGTGDDLDALLADLANDTRLDALLASLADETPWTDYPVAP